MVHAYDGLLMAPKPPSCPNGAPKLQLPFFLSLMPPWSKSRWTAASISSFDVTCDKERPDCGDIALAGCVGNSCVDTGAAIPSEMLQKVLANLQSVCEFDQSYLGISAGLRSPASGVARPGEGWAKIKGLDSSVPGDCAICSSLLNNISSVKLCSPGRPGSSGMHNGPVRAGSSSFSSCLLRMLFMCVLFLVGVSSISVRVMFLGGGVSGLAGVLTGVCPACALYSSGIGDRVIMEPGDGQGISSTVRCSSAKETTELLRGFRLPATVSMMGISMADGAPSLRLERVDRGSTFSSSAMLGRRGLARREVGGEVMVMLPPLFGETIGDFAGLEID